MLFVVNAGLEKPWDRSPTGPKSVGSWGTWRGPDDYENGPFSKNSGSKIVGTVTFQFWRGSPWDPWKVWPPVGPKIICIYIYFLFGYIGPFLKINGLHPVTFPFFGGDQPGPLKGLVPHLWPFLQPWVQGRRRRGVGDVATPHVLSRAPMGYSRTLPTDGGGGVSAPLGSRKVSGRFSKFKRYLRPPYINSPNNMNNCTYRSLMTSQVRSNEKFLLFSQGWAARQINATERNQTFRLTCIVFLTLLNTMLNHSGSGVRSRSSCVMRSRRSNFFSFL